jgi:hypothetical protein
MCARALRVQFGRVLVRKSLAFRVSLLVRRRISAARSFMQCDCVLRVVLIHFSAITCAKSQVTLAGHVFFKCAHTLFRDNGLSFGWGGLGMMDLQHFEAICEHKGILRCIVVKSMLLNVKCNVIGFCGHWSVWFRR